MLEGVIWVYERLELLRKVFKLALELGHVGRDLSAREPAADIGFAQHLVHRRIGRVTAVDAKGRIIFGSTVERVDEDTGKDTVYKIVGEDEADIKTGLISFSSPIARALIGKNEGDVVNFSAPSGEKHYEVIEVRYE